MSLFPIEANFQFLKTLRFQVSISSSATETFSFATPNEGTALKGPLENKDGFSESNKSREVASTNCKDGDPAVAQNCNSEIASQSPAPLTTANSSNGFQEPDHLSSDLSTDARRLVLPVSSAQKMITWSPHSTADYEVCISLTFSTAYGVSN